MSAIQIAREHQWAECGALNAADKRAVPLEELPDILAARTDCHQAIPTVAALGGQFGSAELGDRQATPIVELADAQSFQRTLIEFAANANQKLRRPAAHATLQARSQCTVGGH